MLASLCDFTAELRRAGLPVSLTETLDAASALCAIELGDRSVLRAALSATLVKSASHLPLFETLFDIYFAGLPTSAPVGQLESKAASRTDEVARELANLDADEVDERLRLLLADALDRGTPSDLARLAALAVGLYGGIEGRRPVGVAYYLARTLRRLDLDGVLDGLVSAVLARGQGDLEDSSSASNLPSLAQRLVREDYRRRAERLKAELEAEIRRRLVAERGASAIVKSLRPVLIEDVDVMRASREELAELRRALVPLARVLAARLARRRRRGRHGALDFRRTMRASVSTGGVPLTPRFRSPHPRKPELVVLADVSGSVAAFARFTLHLLYALHAQFSKVRSFVFIDGIDEVTRILQSSTTLPEALGRVARTAEVTGGDGHSDYGNALATFHERFAADIGPRTNLLVLGDARNNYHPAQAWVLEDLRRRARRCYWLNPEPRAYWDSGDSVASQYAAHCDEMVECRTLRQLEAFVDALA